MLKKMLVTAAAAASIVGAAGAATPAMAVGDDEGLKSANGNGAEQEYGNTETGGYMSPNMSLVNGSLNKPCVALPGKVNAGSLVGLVPITVQDVLTSTNVQACNENSTQIDGDDPLSHILSDLDVISENGSENGAVSAR